MIHSCRVSLLEIISIPAVAGLGKTDRAPGKLLSIIFSRFRELIIQIILFIR
jgi:hypothetical protein